MPADAATSEAARLPDSAGGKGSATNVRKRDATATRRALLAAARMRFTLDGYEHTTIRDIAADVGVNQALVYRYFGSKDRLFVEAATEANPMSVIQNVPLEDVPDVALRSIFESSPPLDGPHPLMALLRSTGHDEARELLREKMNTDFAEHLAGRMDIPDGALRAELLAAWVIGIGVLRSMIGTNALSAASVDEVRALFKRGVDAMISAPSDSSS